MSRYADVYKLENLKGPGDARPTALDIVRDENAEGKFAGKVAVVTGTSSGIGAPTVDALVKAGFKVYAGARDLTKAKTALASSLSTGKVELLDIDLTSLASVKAAAEKVRSQEKSLNLLVNNAGVMMVPTNIKTKDGFETQIGTNHFAHFYLFALLRDLLQAGSKSSPNYISRVVNVSSSGHRWKETVLDDINLDKEGAYDPIGAYGNSKTANIWMANQITRIYGKDPRGAIQGYSLMPGGIRTPLQRYVEEWTEQLLKSDEMSRYMRSPEQGAATTLFGAVAKELEGKGGVFLENSEVAPAIPDDIDMEGAGQVTPGYAPYAYSPEKEAALWSLSLKAVGLPADFDKN